LNDHEPTSSEEREAQRALRGLSRPAADPEFQARLRRSFADGAIQPALLGGSESVGSSRARVLRGPWFADRRAQVSLAIAAAVVVVTILVLNRPARWVVTETRGEGIAMVDGQAILLNHRDQLSAALRPGARVRVPIGTQIEIASGGLLIQLNADTDATLPRAPGRWFGRKVLAAIRGGELRITTGRQFRGAQLAIESPEARIEVTGTTLAVIREPAGTCVCVLEGRVRVGPAGGDMAEVESGQLRFVFSDGRDPKNDDMRPVEREALSALKDSRADLLNR
jgi:ferric-dicitrate binding protein FerR (iron transport regulator)